MNILFSAVSKSKFDNNVGVHQQTASFCMSASKKMPLSVSGGQFCLNYKRDVKFMNNVTITFLDEKMIKIKVADLD